MERLQCNECRRIGFWTPIGEGIWSCKCGAEVQDLGKNIKGVSSE